MKAGLPNLTDRSGCFYYEFLSEKKAKEKGKQIPFFGTIRKSFCVAALLKITFIKTHFYIKKKVRTLQNIRFTTTLVFVSIA